MMESEEIAITGIGVVLPGCFAADTMWDQLRLGETQLKLEVDPENASRCIAMGRISDFRPEERLSRVPRRFHDKYDREVQLYLASVFSALEHAQLEIGTYPPNRVGVFDGCSRPMFGAWYEKRRRERQTSSTEAYSRADLMHTPGLAAGIAASLLKVQGSVYTFSSTCSSGSVAIGQAFRELQGGIVDVALATGHESSLFAPVYAMYREAKLLSLEDADPRRAVRSFAAGEASGNAFGEGAVTLVLEKRERAEARGARCYAILKGYRYGNNGSHPTTPDVSGERAGRLLRELLEEIGLSANDIGFVVGHGNGVRLSDASEKNIMRHVFGDRCREVPLVSNKPIYGHTMGASSALNVAAVALMLHHQYIVPTLNAAEGPVSHMAEKGEARACKAGIAMGFGLGGNNTAVLLQRYGRGSADV